MLIVIAVVVGLGLIAAVAVPAYLERGDESAHTALSTVGVSEATADCDPATDDEVAENASTHVGPGTDFPDTTRVDYAQVPPSSGEHFAQSAFPARPFYTARDRPRMEQLVHNIEHGYTILWYDDTIKGGQLDELKDIAASARDNDATGPTGKFIVSAWDDAYGEFPSGKHVALSHWGAEQGHRQLCGNVSGDVVEAFIEDFPASDAPEPDVP